MPKFNVELSITGLQEAQRKNQQDIRALQPSGALGEAIKAGMIAAHGYAVKLSHQHVDTGTWKAAHRMAFRDTGPSPIGEVYIDPGAINPRSGTPAEVYATVWEERAGDMAVYMRTRDERGPQITRMMQGVITKAMAD